MSGLRLHVVWPEHATMLHRPSESVEIRATERMRPEIRAELVRLLASALVADVRQYPTLATSPAESQAATGTSPTGNARKVVGRLHKQPLTCATYESAS